MELDFSGAHLTVVGDLILDIWTRGEVRRKSPEAPVPVLSNLDRTYTPGGAANVASNLSALGAKCELIGIVDAGMAGSWVRVALTEMPHVFANLFTFQDWMTPIKERLIGPDGHLLRMDTEQFIELREEQETELLRVIQGSIRVNHGVIISDYGKGTITPRIARETIKYARERGKPVFVDSKKPWSYWFQDAFCFTPNIEELFSQENAKGWATVGRNATMLHISQGAEWVLVTKSEDGMSLVGTDAFEREWLAMAERVVDVSGAGDTVIATLAAAYVAGYPMKEAVTLSNYAAAEAVGQPGTTAVGLQEAPDFHLIQRVQRTKDGGHRVGFTNGCFDGMHEGHRALLKWAQENCDVLVVAVNDDASVRGLKGQGRPQRGFGTRRDAVKALMRQNDIVVDFYWSPYTLIEMLRPHVIFKGDDYTVEQVTGHELAEVMLLPRLSGVSTTEELEHAAV